jgi:hypothetical protein
MEDSETRETNDFRPTPRFDKLWEWSLHEDTLFSNRVNFMLVGESMLFAGFATLLSAQSLHKGALLTIGILGVLVSLVWLWVARKQLCLVNKPIQIELKKAWPEYEEMAGKREKWWQRPHNIIGVFLPIILMVAWVFLLCFGLGVKLCISN